jgi:hypothetical protein
MAYLLLAKSPSATAVTLLRVDFDGLSPFLQLPDPCLLLVLKGCAEDPRSLFSAARAHSRLHQAAVVAASSIRAAIKQQQQADSVLLYLRDHGQHVSSIDLHGMTSSFGWGVPNPVTLKELPHSSLQRLESLQLKKLCLQLQPGSGFQGVLQAAPAVGRLRLDDCMLLDELGEGLLSPSLQHLSLTYLKYRASGTPAVLPRVALEALQQLTYLDLSSCHLQPDGLEHLSGLTNLQYLRMHGPNAPITARMLSGAARLTRLEVSAADIEPGCFAGKPKLREIVLKGCRVEDKESVPVELLSSLPQLHQLTYLKLWSTLGLDKMAPAEAYSALTANSKLQHLDITHCTLPVGAWQHIFPAGRQLPHLRELMLKSLYHPEGLNPDGPPAIAPEGSRLVSCCPGLQLLCMMGLQCSSELLSPLQRLSGLTALQLYPPHWSNRFLSQVDVVSQITGLRDLQVADYSPSDGLLLQLTQLRQLTQLSYQRGTPALNVPHLSWCCEVRTLSMQALASSDGALTQPHTACKPHILSVDGDGTAKTNLPMQSSPLKIGTVLGEFTLQSKHQHHAVGQLGTDWIRLWLWWCQLSAGRQWKGPNVRLTVSSPSHA